MIFKTTKWAIGLTLIAVIGKLLFNQFSPSTGAESAVAKTTQSATGSVPQATASANPTKVPSDLLSQMRAKNITSAGGFKSSSPSDSEQWQSLLTKVVASDDWAATIGTLQQHPDANRWMESFRFMFVCLMATSSNLQQNDPRPIMPASARVPWTETMESAKARCGDYERFNKAINWRKLPEVVAVPMGTQLA